jgi:hypothetical protein
MRSIVLLAAVLAIFGSGANGAVLLRFINTVPSKQDYGVPAVTGSGRTSVEIYTERIGLQYFAQTGTNNNLESPTLVWTEAVNPRDAEATTAPYAFSHAMPPLRGYHALGSSTTMVDQIANYKSSQLPSTWSTTNNNDQSAADNYEQTSLKSDGVGLYLAFAAGTYQVQAYAVTPSLSATAALSALPRQLTNSLRSVTFEDGKVYTMVATGDGKYSDSTSPTNGNTVQLVLFEESVAPTTFGMASLRWFHSIKTQSTNAISIFKTDTSNGNQVANSINFGSVSDYVDVAPGTSTVFLATVNSGNSQTVVIPNSASRVESTHDVRAGLRATIICAVQDETTATTFCRMIPSRIVAYVRLINDLSGQNNLVQGAFGAIPAKDTKLTLWASYEYPRPSQVMDLSQNMGTNNIPRVAPWSRGLYGVVSAVASASCSGYGEVFVPMLIMDFAVRFTIIRDNTQDFAQQAATTNNFVAATGTNPNSYSTAGADNQKNPTLLPIVDWFWAAPIFKRVNFIVKTEGFATLAGWSSSNTAMNAIRDVSSGLRVWYDSALLLDQYIEPGQYYSIIVTAPANTFTTTGVQQSQITRFYARVDRSVDTVASGVPANKAIVNWIPFGTQVWTGSSVNFRQKGTSNINLVPSFAVATNYVKEVSIPGTPTGAPFTWNDPATQPGLTADAGDYTFDFNAVAGSASSCTTRIPGTNDLTIAVGDVWDVYVLNVYGCTNNNNDLNSLVVRTCKTQSAIVTNHAVNTLLDGAPATSTPTFFIASASSVSSSVAMIFAALLAVIAALL